MVDLPKLKMKDGNEIPAMGYGTYRLKGNECRRSVKSALKAGYTHIDTAEMYGNESEIGEVIDEVDRSDLFITSKVSPKNLHHDDLIEACESSLERLDTEYLDLYLIHWPNENIPTKETFSAMGELHKQEKVKSIGVSNFTIPEIKEAMDVSPVPVTANQVEFHPWLYQEELLDFCNENDIILIAYAPLARTKVLQDETIQELAEKYDKTPGQITLRWEVEKGTVPIPKAGSEPHIKENIQLFDWELDPEDVERIDSISKENRLINFHYSSF